ncbi:MULTISPECIES: CCC motif membrane protein [unclassified Chryseobacterium]|uniref:CCC motif membrane protein n=1 Tax=unclassified Chryseobacterium TaxID=2593645 RepID=UPI00226AC2B7|nr:MULTISPECIES: CCC motif membrane protein [unclassified Chryseobacterium]
MNQKLPNAQTVLILGIISVVGTCCCTGLIGIICGLIGLNKYKSDKILYDKSPTEYSDFGNLNTGRILCMIGLGLGCLQVLYFIFILATVGWDGYMEQINELSRMGRQ